jgi:hypothetical protein
VVVETRLENKTSFKIRIFLWLALSNEVLTREICRKRAWQRPRKCVLCKRDDETLDHLLVRCSFTKGVWKEALQLNEGYGSWIGISVAMCLDKWFKDNTIEDLGALPCVVSWVLLLARNDMIFQNRHIPLIQVIH